MSFIAKRDNFWFILSRVCSSMSWVWSTFRIVCPDISTNRAIRRWRQQQQKHAYIWINYLKVVSIKKFNGAQIWLLKKRCWNEIVAISIEKVIQPNSKWGPSVCNLTGKNPWRLIVSPTTGQSKDKKKVKNRKFEKLVCFHCTCTCYTRTEKLENVLKKILRTKKILEKSPKILFLDGLIFARRNKPLLKSNNNDRNVRSTSLPAVLECFKRSLGGLLYSHQHWTIQHGNKPTIKWE